MHVVIEYPHMRIAVVTDIHANLPALEAAMKSIKADGCDAIFHTGDALAIGPHPAECLDLLLDTPNIRFVMGNHDSYFADGLPDPIPDTMSEGEVEHQHWTHAQLDPKKRAVLAQWPYSLTYDFEGTKVAFIHYGLAASGRDFTPTIRNATALELDSIFSADDVSLLFYGHNHRQSDIQGRARYLNPGSLGCFDQPVARYYIVDFRHGGYTLKHRSVSYDDGALLRAFDERQVPEREFIFRVFFGGRFWTI
jgi:putative phosphoesterase